MPISINKYHLLIKKKKNTHGKCIKLSFQIMGRTQNQIQEDEKKTEIQLDAASYLLLLGIVGERKETIAVKAWFRALLGYQEAKEKEKETKAHHKWNNQLS